MLENLTRDQFAAQLGSTFQIRLPGIEPLDLVLTQVSELQIAPKQESFSLLFRGPTNKLLPQSIYPLEHAQMGTLELV